MTRDMMHRVAAHLAAGGDLYLIAEAADMTRARDALADYRLAIRWPECQQFDTNLIGTYQWCPLDEKVVTLIAVLVPCYNEEAAIATVVRISAPPCPAPPSTSMTTIPRTRPGAAREAGAGAQ